MTDEGCQLAHVVLVAFTGARFDLGRFDPCKTVKPLLNGLLFQVVKPGGSRLP